MHTSTITSKCTDKQCGIEEATLQLHQCLKEEQPDVELIEWLARNILNHHGLSFQGCTNNRLMLIQPFTHCWNGTYHAYNAIVQVEEPNRQKKLNEQIVQIRSVLTKLLDEHYFRLIKSGEKEGVFSL
jgi:hypothetical protein